MAKLKKKHKSVIAAVVGPDAQDENGLADVVPSGSALAGVPGAALRRAVSASGEALAVRLQESGVHVQAEFGLYGADPRTPELRKQALGVDRHRGAEDDIGDSPSRSRTPSARGRSRTASRSSARSRSRSRSHSRSRSRSRSRAQSSISSFDDTASLDGGGSMSSHGGSVKRTGGASVSVSSGRSGRLSSAPQLNRKASVKWADDDSAGP